MNKLLLFCLLLPAFCSAQWVQRFPGATYDLHASWATSSNTGFVAGTEGVFKTENGGATWEESEPTDFVEKALFDLSSFYALDFPTANIGYAAGWYFSDNNEVIFRTTDGGLDWTPVHYGGAFGTGILDMQMLSTTYGYAVGLEGRILHTNTGLSWNAQNSGTFNNLLSVHFIDANNGYVGGENIVLKTTNGGANWVAVSNAISPFAIHFFDENNGIAGGDSLYFTSNGGTTWSAINENSPNYFEMLFAISADTIFGGANNSIYKSIDGGVHWFEQESISNFISTVHFFGDFGIGAGYNGTVFTTNNGGDAVRLNDIGITASSTTAPITCPGVYSIMTSISNFGADTIYSSTINWTVNGVTQTPYNWVGVLPPKETTDSVIIGGVNIVDVDIDVWTSLPNGVVDEKSSNDMSSSSYLVTQLSGTYTIGGASPDFVTINDALDSLHAAGICGPVTFNIRDGVYEESLQLNSIAGMSATNTIVFQSESGINTSVVISDTPGTTNNSLADFNGVNYCTIRNVSLKMQYSVLPVVQLDGENNHLIGNIIEHKSTASQSDGYTNIYSGAGSDHNIVSGNTIVNGAYGIRCNPTSSMVGVNIEGNEFVNQYQSAIWGEYLDSLTILNNTITSNSTYSSFYGLYLYRAQNELLIEDNTFDLKKGIAIYTSYSSEVSGLICNNFITVQDGTGMALSSFGHAKVYFNSVHCYGNTGTPMSIGVINADIINNVFANYAGGVAIRATSSSGTPNPSTADYNCLYSNGIYIAEWAESHNNLISYTQASGSGNNSILVDPQFTDSDLHIDLKSENYLINNKGIPIQGITTDIDGELRDTINPDMGADEFGLPAIDVGLFDESIDNYICSGNQNKEVRIKNYGTTSLTSAVVNWKVNGNIQAAIPWSGNLVMGDTSSTIQLGSYNFIQGTQYILEIWTSNPNGLVDEVTRNDIITDTLISKGLIGIYTIGGSNPDFSTLSLAVDSLITEGVCGPTTFNIRSGTYNEEITIPEIDGTSSNSKIIIQSEILDSTAVIISGSSNEINLTGADHLTIKNVTIINGIDVTGGSNYIEVSNCVLGGYSAIGNTKDEYTTISNNLITGYSGINIVGPMPNYGGVEKGIIIRNNHLNAQGYNVIRAERLYAPTIVGNILEDAGVLRGGISTSDSHGSITILNNKANSIVGSNWNNSPTERAVIANNMLRSNLRTIDLNNTSSTFCDIYHNTLISEPTITINTYVVQIAGNINFKNNIVVQSSLQHGLISYTGVNENLNSDHNVVWSKGSMFIYTHDGSAMKTYTNWDTWKKDNGQDDHSFNINPEFVSDNDFHINNDYYVNNGGVAIPGITSDIDGDIRNTLTPDIGADEYDLIRVLDDAGVWGMIDYTNVCPTAPTSIDIRIKNHGSNPLNSATIRWMVNGVQQPDFLWTGALSTDSVSAPITIGSYPFLGSVDYDIKHWTEYPNGVTDVTNTNDTLNQNTINPPLGGIYTIGGSAPYDYKTFADATNALNVYGICGPVVFNVRNGIYKEAFNIPAVSGASAINSITFQSESGDSTSVLIQGGSDNYVLKLNQAQYVTISKMSLESTANYVWCGVVLFNNAHNNTITNCIIKSARIHNASHQYYYPLIYNSETADSNNTITNNHFENGGYGVSFVGNTSGTRSPGNTITGNEFYNGFSGIRLKYQKDVEVNSNRMITDLINANDAITLDDLQGTIEVSNNIIYGVFRYGISMVDLVALASNPGIIANNAIAGGNSMYVGIKGNDCDFINICYNSVKINHPWDNTTPLYLEYSSGINLLNNNFIGGDYTLYGRSNFGLNTLSNNNYYTLGPYVIRWESGFYASVDSFASATGYDSTSISTNPLFISTTDFHFTSDTIVGKGVPIAGITLDLDGKPRDPLSPTIGCYENAGPGDTIVDSFRKDLVVAEIANDSLFVGSNAIGVNVVNAQIFNLNPYYTYGGDVDSVYLTYQINDEPAVTELWTGALALNDTLKYTFSTLYNIPRGRAFTIRAWIELSSTSKDLNVHNDTTEKILSIPMFGVYTIGGASPDFLELQDAVYNLDIATASSMVYFDLRPGQYSGSISANGPVTYRSESGNPEDVIMEYIGMTKVEDILLSNVTIKPRTPNANYPFVGMGINQCNNVIIDSCIVQGHGINSIGKGISLYRSSNSTISNTKFSNLPEAIDYSDVEVDGSNWFTGSHYITNNQFDSVGVGIQMHGAMFLIDTCVISHNIFNQPDYGIVMEGDEEAKYRIDINNNTMIDCKSSGIKVDDTRLYDSRIASNIISASNQAIILNASENNSYIESIEIFNNMLSTKHHSKVTTPTDTNYMQRVIWFASVSDILFNNNSCYGGATMSYPSNLTLRNNCFYTDSAIVLQGRYLNEYIGSNNNYYRKDGGSIVYLGYNYIDHTPATVINSIDELIAQSGHENNSISVDPMYFALDDLHSASHLMNNMGTPLALVTDDIDGEPRDLVTPDIGADEYTPGYGVDIGMINLRVDSMCTNLGYVYANIVNYGIDSLKKATVHWSMDGIEQTRISVNEIVLAGDTSSDVLLGTYNFINAGLVDLSSWTGLSNQAMDTIKVNDSSSYSLDVNHVDLGVDTSICVGSTHIISVDTASFNFILWNTGVSTPSISLDSSSVVWLDAIDTNGCVSSDTFSIQVNPFPTLTLTEDTTACQGDIINLYVSGATSYSWSPSNGLDCTNCASPIATVSNSIAYVVVGSDSIGCSSLDTVNIDVDTTVTIAEIINTSGLLCFGDNDGEVEVLITAGYSPFTLAWSSTNTDGGVLGTYTESNLSPGAVAVSITDVKGCSIILDTIVNEPIPLVVTASGINPSCYGTSDGDVTAIGSGGTGAITYNWSSFGVGQNHIGVASAPASYTVTVTDANNCTSTDDISIAQPPLLLSDVIGANISCYGDSDGIGTVNFGGGSPPYDIRWSSSVSITDHELLAGSNSETGLVSGNYTVTVTDASLCAITSNISLTEPTEIIVTETTTPLLCCGDNNGTISIEITQGTTPFIISWSTSDTQVGPLGTYTETALVSGDYTVTISDANNCTVTIDTTIYEPSKLSVSSSSENESTANSADGSATINATGGVSGYTYLWQDGQSSVVATGLSMGNYCCKVTDLNGCSVNTCVSVGLDNTSINELTKYSPIEVNGNKISVKLRQGHLEIYNLTGQRVHQSILTGNTSISLNQKGIYLVRVIDEGRSVTEKVYLH